MAEEKKLDYITNKLDYVAEKVADIDIKLQVHIAKFDAAVEDNVEDRRKIEHNTDILSENTSSLAEHIKRTEMLENYIKVLEGRFTPVEVESARKKAVEEWVKEKLVLMAKIGGAVTGVGALAAAIKFLISYLG